MGTSLATDPPDHRALRKVLMERLSPRALRDIEADIDSGRRPMVAELVEARIIRGMDDLARALPLTVVADLIGVQGRVRENMLVWGEAAFNCLGPMNERTAQSFPIAGELFQWSVECKAEDLTEGSLGRAIFDAAERGEISHADLRDDHPPVCGGGDGFDDHGTRKRHLPPRHPSGPVRLDAPGPLTRSPPRSTRSCVMSHRSMPSAVRDGGLEIEGTMIPGGSQAVLLYGAANRDPRQYDDPDVFRIERDPGDHLSFGHGPHVCAGRGLAKLEIYAVLDALARRVRRLTIGEPTRRLGNSTRSFDKLPVLGIEPA